MKYIQEENISKLNEIAKQQEEERISKLKRENKDRPATRIHTPPVKLQFNMITQAVNNSISSVGTNTTTTPLATSRKPEEHRQPFTDRGVIDKPIIEDRKV